MTELVYIDESKAYALYQPEELQSGGYLLSSEDGGETWSSVTTQGIIYNIFPGESGSVWFTMVSNYQKLYKTTDEFATFESFDRPTTTCDPPTPDFDNSENERLFGIIWAMLFVPTSNDLICNLSVE